MKFKVYTKLCNGAITMDADEMFEEGSYTCFSRDNITVKYPTSVIEQINQEDTSTINPMNKSMRVMDEWFTKVKEDELYMTLTKPHYIASYRSDRSFDYSSATQLAEQVSKLYHAKRVAIQCDAKSLRYYIIFDYEY